MTENFTTALRTAAEEAHKAGAPVIGMEHLLLGALRQEGSAAVRLLASHGITWQMVYERYAATLLPTYPPHPSRTPGQESFLPFTPKAAQVVEVANAIAQGHAGVSHLLAALLHERGVSEGLRQAAAASQGRPPYDVDQLEKEIKEMINRGANGP